jgi:hypothetical protein
VKDRPAGPSRNLKDWIVAQWTEAHARPPGWAASPHSWIRLAELHRLIGEDEIRSRWTAYLEDDSRPWSTAHLMTTFVSVSDMYAASLRPQTAAEYWEDRRLKVIEARKKGS